MTNLDLVSGECLNELHLRIHQRLLCSVADSFRLAVSHFCPVIKW